MINTMAKLFIGQKKGYLILCCIYKLDYDLKINSNVVVKNEN
jgi:hypothetical protein